MSGDLPCQYRGLKPVFSEGRPRPVVPISLGSAKRVALLTGWWCVLLAIPLAVLGAPERMATPAPGTPAPLAPPAPPSPTAEIEKWIAAFDAQWRADFDRSIAKPYAKGVAELRRQYLAAMEAPLALAMRTGRTEDAAAWREERDRISSDTNAPPAADDKGPSALKGLRRNYRTQLAQLSKDREERVRALLARCDDVLTKKQAVSKAEKRLDEVAAVQDERDRLRADWLPAADAAAAAAPPPAPAATIPATGKLTSQQILDKLRELGAEVAVKPRGGPVQQIQSDTQRVEGKFTFVSVNFRPERPDQTPLTTADYDILDSLSEVEELGLAGPAVKDPVMEKLRLFHALRSLTLNRARPSAAGYTVLPALPGLRQLQIYDTGATSEAMAAVTQCRKLQSLSLGTLALEDDALADLGKLTELQSLQLSELDKLTSKGFAHLAECRSLRSLSASGFVILSGMVEHLGRCKSLEYLALPNTFLKDAEVAPLGALPKLRSLDLSNSPVTGAVFAQWRAHKEFESLGLRDAAGVDDAACKNIEKAFPKLQSLEAKLAPTGFTRDGATALGRLHELRSLHLGGTGLTDDLVDQITHATNITSLAIPTAQLTDPGAAAIGRLSHLTELSLDMPPITDAAVKSFARCKELKVVNIGKDALPDTEYKLQSAVPGLVVHRPED